MKKRTVSCSALFAAVMICVSSSCSKENGRVDSVQPPSADRSEFVASDVMDGQTVAAKNDRYALLYDPMTTAVRFKDLQTGASFSSSPDPKEYADIGGVTDVTNQIQSSLILRYYEGNTEKTLLSYSDCVSKQQFKVYEIEDGIRMEYTVGEAQSYEVFPCALTAAYVEETLLPELSETDKELFLRYYIKQSYQEMDESTRNEYCKIYPNFPRYDFYQQYKADEIPIKFRRSLQKMFANAGLTLEVMKQEYERMGYQYTLKAAPSFFVPVEYRLQKDSLEAVVCADEIRYSDEFKLTALDFLPFFGACAERDDGYAFIPDGSGILVNLNNQSNVPISIPVFGEDLNRDQSNTSDRMKSEPCYFPVFGCKQGNDGFFTVLSDGAAQAEINMTPPRNVTHLNRVYASYSLMERQSFSPNGLNKSWTFTNYSPYGYSGKIVQNIYILNGAEAGYAGMASLYRGLLFADREKHPQTSPAVYVETYGDILRRKTTVGIDGYEPDAFTTIGQFSQMLDILDGQGVTDIRGIFHNWGSDPNFGQVKTGDKPSAEVGTKRELTALLQKSNQLALDFNVLYSAETTSAISSLNMRNCAAYSVQNNYLQVGNDRPNEQDTQKYAFNFRGISGLFQNAEKAADSLGAFCLFIPDIGKELYSDFNKNSFMSRDDMRKCITEIYADLSKKRNLTIDGANAYLLPYTDTALNVPLGGSNFYACDEEVPFLQMVIGGYVNYTGESISLSHNKRQQFLKSLEFGAVPFFTLNWSGAAMLKNSHYSYLSGTQFSYNADAVVSMAREYTEAFSVVNSGIVSHVRLSDTVTKTCFSGGTIIINYSGTVQTVDGITINPESYMITKEIQ